MKKGWIITGVILAVLAGGAYGIKSYIAKQIGDEVVQLTQDPEVQKTINKAIEDGLKQQAGDIKLPEGTPATDAQKTGAGGTASVPASADGGGQAGQPAAPAKQEQQPAAPAIANRAEAVAYAQSKFSATEIAQFSSAYANRKNLSKAEKDEIKQQILSRFTPQELQALQQAASK